MILKYGNYAHANNEVSITIDRQASKRDQSGRLEEEVERWLISGFLQAASATALTTAINSLKSAYATDNLDLTLYQDNGTTETSHSMKRLHTIRGPLVIQRPSFPQGRGAEYATYRSYQIQIEGTFIGDPNIELTDYRETIQFSGGGERWAYKETLQGPPQRQTLAQQTTYQAVQSGYAVGRLAYPSPAPPLWPSQEHTDQRRLVRLAPKREGEPSRSVFRDWRVEWTYVFESPVPLNGNPNLWRRG